MNLHGRNFVGDRLSSGSGETIDAANPFDSSILQPTFHATSEEDVNAAMESDEAAFETYRETTGEQRAVFLERIGAQPAARND